MHDSRTAALQTFVDRCARHVTADEKGQAQIFLDRLFVAFGRRAAPDATAPRARASNPKADLLAQLLALNGSVAAKERAGESVTPPGVPATVGDARGLVSEDCIRP